jgi:D-arabinose 1-dehydrogenase-like Zn-dependent alcohol dehydrogenase
MLDAVRTAKDGEYVTVESKDDNVRVAKSSGYLYIHVTEKKPSEKTAKAAGDKDSSAKNATLKQSKVEVKIPMKVVDALLSAGKDELDVVAALRALSANGDMELVSVKDDDNTVRVWIDSKNVSN